MKEKTGTIIQHVWMKALDKIPKDKAFDIIKALVNLDSTGEMPDFETGSIEDVLFSEYSHTVLENRKKYEDTCRNRSEAAKRRAAGKSQLSQLSQKNDVVTIVTDMNRCDVNRCDVNSISADADINTAPNPSEEDIQRITDAWNRNEFCTKIGFKITPMSTWYDKIRIVVSQFGMDHLISTIDDLKNQEWFVDRWNKRKIFVDFRWFIELDNYQNVISGKYKHVFEKSEKKEKPKNRFNDFDQRTYTEFDAIENAMMGG